MATTDATLDGKSLLEGTPEAELERAADVFMEVDACADGMLGEDEFVAAADPHGTQSGVFAVPHLANPPRAPRTASEGSRPPLLTRLPRLTMQADALVKVRKQPPLGPVKARAAFKRLAATGANVDPGAVGGKPAVDFHQWLLYVRNRLPPPLAAEEKADDGPAKELDVEAMVAAAGADAARAKEEAAEREATAAAAAVVAAARAEEVAIFRGPDWRGEEADGVSGQHVMEGHEDPLDEEAAAAAAEHAVSLERMYHDQLVARAAAAAETKGELPPHFLDDAQLGLALRFFAAFDADGDGVLSEKECRRALEGAARHSGQRFNPWELSQLFHEADLDRSPARSKWPSWRGHGWPPRDHQSASEGLGLPSALARRGPASQTPPRGRGLPARGRPSRRVRRVGRLRLGRPRHLRDAQAAARARAAALRPKG